MKILLINPPRVYEKGERPFLVFPLGLGYIASSIKERDIHLLDCVGPYSEMMHDFNDHRVHGLPIAQILERIDESDPDVVLLSVSFSTQHEFIVRLLEGIRESPRKRVVVLGGNHASAMHGFFVENRLADYVVVGEGESTLPALMDSIENGELPALPSVSMLRDGLLSSGRIADVCMDIDDIQFPAWDLFDMGSYLTFPHKHTMKKSKRRVMEVLTSRGCPVGCDYCASAVVFGRPFRKRSLDNLFKEIDVLRERYGVEEIHFLDDNILLDRPRFKDICREMNKRRLVWSIPNGVNLQDIDGNLIRMMSRCGCDSLFLAIEAANQDILRKHSPKRIDLDKAKRMIGIAQSRGLWTVGFFIIGFPEETKEDIERTVTFASGSGLDEVHLSILTPLPGTGFEGYIGKDFGVLNAKRANIPVRMISEDEIESIRNRGYISFELRTLFRKKISYLSQDNMRRLIRYAGYALR